MKADDPRHGTNAGYIAGCREDDCKAAHAAYRRKFRARRYLQRVDTFRVPALGTVRRIRALQALGWRYCDIDRAMGYDRPSDLNGDTVSHNLVDQEYVLRDTAAKVAAVYDQLSMKPGPSDRVRRHAARKGYAPPLAWDDAALDDPNAKPHVGTKRNDRRKHDLDPVVVERVLGGDRLPMTRAERVEVVRVARERGWSEREIEERTGIAKATDRSRYGEDAA